MVSLARRFRARLRDARPETLARRLDPSPEPIPPCVYLPCSVRSDTATSPVNARIRGSLLGVKTTLKTAELALRSIILERDRLPELAQAPLRGLAGQLKALGREVQALERRILNWHRSAA